MVSVKKGRVPQVQPVGDSWVFLRPFRALKIIGRIPTVETVGYYPSAPPGRGRNDGCA